MTAPRAPRLAGRLEALLLVAFGVAALVFAEGPRYTALMNPSFRWVTLAGAALLTSLGLVLLLRPRRVPGRSALLAFGVLAGLVVLGRPDRVIGGSLQPPDVGPALTREGYDPLLIEALFHTLSEEKEDVPEGKVVVQGRVHRILQPDGTTLQVLLYPKVACCLADALAYAVRLDLPASGDVPPDASWVYVFGDLRRAPVPIETPPFRVGAIAYTVVSRGYRLEAGEIVDYRALLEDLTTHIPEAQCGAFRRALEATGLQEMLEGDGPYTVFAPINSVFLRQIRTLANDGTEEVDAPRLRRYLESFVVRGSLSRSDLIDRKTIETLSGRTLSIVIDNGRPLVEGSRILFADQLGRNGLVHIVHPAWAPETD